MTLITRSSVSTNVSSIRKDVGSDKTIHYIGKHDFVLTMGVTYSPHSLLDDYFKDYIELYVQAVHAVTDENGVQTSTIRDLELET